MAEDCDQPLTARLWERAQTLLCDQHWTWPAEVEEAAERLTNDPTLTLSALWATQRAVAIGFALRNAESDLISGAFTFDDDYADKLARWSIDDPCMAISAGALAVRDDLPGPFRPSAEAWDELLARAVADTRTWAVEMHGEPGAPPDAVIGRSVALGYGLAYSYAAIQSVNPLALERADGAETLPSATPTLAGGEVDAEAAWGLAGGQARATAEECMSSFRLGRGEPTSEHFPLCLHLTYAASGRVDVLRMHWADREEVVALLTEQIVENDACAAALLIPEQDSGALGMMPCAFRILTVGCDGHMDETRARIRLSRQGFPEKLRRWKVLGVYFRSSDTTFPDYALAMLEGFVRNGRGAQIPSILFE